MADRYSSPDLLRRRLAHADGKVGTAYMRDPAYHAQVQWTEQVLAIMDTELMMEDAVVITNKIADALIGGAGEALARIEAMKVKIAELAEETRARMVNDLSGWRP